MERLKEDGFRHPQTGLAIVGTEARELAGTMQRSESSGTQPEFYPLSVVIDLAVAGSTDIAALMMTATSGESAYQVGMSFADLATQRPDELLAIIKRGILAPGALTWAAEAAGCIRESEAAVPVLLGLLDHESPLVREGAVYGLAEHRDEKVVVKLNWIAMNDQDDAVKRAARVAAEEW